MKELLSKRLSFYLSQIKEFSKKVVSDPNEIEHLHQFRVYSRRAKSLLKEFANCFEPTYYQQAILILSNFLKMSNRARDLDTLLVALEKFKPPMDITPLKKVIKKERDKVYEELLGELTQVGSMVYTIREPKVLECKKRLILKRLNKRLKKISTLSNSLKTDKDFHKLRISIKQARYTAELAKEEKLIPKKTLKELKKLQDKFGKIQDYSIWIKELYEVKDNISSKETLMGMGKIVGDLVEKKEKLKKKVTKVAEKLRERGL